MPIGTVDLAMASWSEETSSDSDHALVAALADAERLCGVSITPPVGELNVYEYAAQTIAEFGGAK